MLLGKFKRRPLHVGVLIPGYERRRVARAVCKVENQGRTMTPRVSGPLLGLIQRRATLLPARTKICSNIAARLNLKGQLQTLLWHDVYFQMVTMVIIETLRSEL